MSIVQAVILGVLFIFVKINIMYTIPKNSPMFVGLLIGLVLGDVKQAIIIGAALQAIYLGFISPGGNIPSDLAVASFIAIPIAIINKLDPQVAVSLAVPVGLLGLLLEYIRRTLNASFVHMADKYAENADVKGIRRAAYLYPTLLVILIYFVPMTLAIYYGPAAVNVVMKSIPEWFIHGLSVAGGILPALGFAITISVIGKKQMIPYFIVGFLLFRIAPGVNTITLAVFGAFFAYLHVLFTSNKTSEEGGIM
ncbi:PTS sugar transporter subunit IIC [Clostridium sp. CF012]|uniref:PTS mannose/fructose/sorbose/N-acetylgalactosamine transporter subunit IIC n=1 Tax=Clostridium sp. CF012 TaxID=2843319 RepID=UPI001C0BEC8A|nr:PTS sugar transporter subunit IIC [Clostridium sp. CF012]MBU3143268.1 PTS sugar transporter subunit IIC [Clostridium sp. CF012]